MPDNVIKSYFGFNRQQRNGLYVLMLISLLLLLVRIVYPYCMRPGKIIVQNLPLIEKQLENNSALSHKITQKKFSAKGKPTQLFEFDPNTVSAYDLMRLGFSEKKAATFIRFRERGFVFREKKDLQKVYGVSRHLYDNLEPYIVIRAKYNKDQAAVHQAKPATNRPDVHYTKAPIVELNTADSAVIETLNGIGPAFSKRIIKYRSMLGGFTGKEQLLEVYGFKEELYEKIKNSVTVDAAKVKKINLNTGDFKTITRHPYIGFERTKTIFSFRKKTNITAANLNEVLKDSLSCAKLLPYLSFD